jgi:energy-converting hydrogenase Eha subunit B
VFVSGATDVVGAGVIVVTTLVEVTTGVGGVVVVVGFSIGRKTSCSGDVVDVGATSAATVVVVASWLFAAGAGEGDTVAAMVVVVVDTVVADPKPATGTGMAVFTDSPALSPTP